MSSTPSSDSPPVPSRRRAAPRRFDPANHAPADNSDPSAGTDGAEEAHATAEAESRGLAEELKIPFRSDLGDWYPSSQFIERVPIGFARQYALLGITNDRHDDASLTVAMGSLDCWQQLDILARHLRREVHPVLVPLEVILSAINTAYQQRTDQSRALVEGLDVRETIEFADGLIGGEDLLDSAARPPVVKLVNSILFEAVRARASDIHV